MATRLPDTTREMHRVTDALNAVIPRCRCGKKRAFVVFIEHPAHNLKGDAITMRKVLSFCEQHGTNYAGKHHLPIKGGRKHGDEDI